MSACVCIRRVALERNCRCLCVYLCVCCACPSLCTNGEIGGESHPEGKGHSPCKGEKGNSIFLDITSKYTRSSLCLFPSLLIELNLDILEELPSFQRVTSYLLHSYLSARLSTTNQADFYSPFNMPQLGETTFTFVWEGWNLTTPTILRYKSYKSFSFF